MFGKILSADTKALMSEAHLGKAHTTETKALISQALSKNKNAIKSLFVYSFNLETKETKLFKSFNSCIEAAEYFECKTYTISKYLDKNKLYKKTVDFEILWQLSDSK